jgi:eukaryotic-like serine/threonine-protein kinase
MDLSKGKEVMFSFFRFLKTKIFLTHLAIATAGGLVFGMFMLFFFDFFTHHGEANSVPDFRGMTLKEALDKADDNNLQLLVIDSVYNAEGRKGTIVEQTPPANFKVKKNRTIFITIKTLNPERIPMPKITGVSLIQAKAELETYGLSIGKLYYQPDIATNLVLEQYYKGKSIRSGKIIDKGSKIDLLLGMKSGEVNTTVPNLFGLSENIAIQKTTDFSLNIGTVIFDKTVKSEIDSIKAKVYKQSPGAFTGATIGSKVDIWLTLDKKKLEKK